MSQQNPRTTSERGLDPDPDEMRRIGYRLVDFLVDDLEGISDQRVSQRHSADDFEALREPLPEKGNSFDSNFDQLTQHVLPGLTRVHHPRFHAYLPSAGSYVGSLGNFLASGLNSFVGSWLGGGAMSMLELVVLEWLADFVRYPKAGSGLLTSGGSMANLIGIAAGCARYEERAPLTFYASEQAHASCNKAALTLGLKPSNLRSVRCTEGLQMDATDLRHKIAVDRQAGLQPAVVCANAGTTNTGTVDPLAEIAEVCRAEGLWFHIDGAYGGFAAACRESSALFEGMECADSLALDPHKWLYAPMGVGCVLFREPGSSERAFTSSGDYLRDTQLGHEINFFDRGPELSRPARALSVWLSLKTSGAERLREEISEDLRLAQLAERRIAAIPGLEIVCPASLSVVTFRFGIDPDSLLAQELMEATLASGELMISTTELDHRTALRFVVMNHRTTEAEINRSLETLGRLASELQG